MHPFDSDYDASGAGLDRRQLLRKGARTLVGLIGLTGARGLRCRPAGAQSIFVRVKTADDPRIWRVVDQVDSIRLVRFVYEIEYLPLPNQPEPTPALVQFYRVPGSRLPLVTPAPDAPYQDIREWRGLNSVDERIRRGYDLSLSFPPPPDASLNADAALCFRHWQRTGQQNEYIRLTDWCSFYARPGIEIQVWIGFPRQGQDPLFRFPVPEIPLPPLGPDEAANWVPRDTVGIWRVQASTSRRERSVYQFGPNEQQGTHLSCLWNGNLAARPGTPYLIYAYVPEWSGASPLTQSAQYTVTDAGGSHPVFLDQRAARPNDWTPLVDARGNPAEFSFSAGVYGVQLTNRTADSDATMVVADGLFWRRKDRGKPPA